MNKDSWLIWRILYWLSSCGVIKTVRLTSTVWISPPERRCLHRRWTSCSSDMWSILGDISVPLQPARESQQEGNNDVYTERWNATRSHGPTVDRKPCFKWLAGRRFTANVFHRTSWEAIMSGRRSRARSGRWAPHVEIEFAAARSPPPELRALWRAREAIELWAQNKKQSLQQADEGSSDHISYRESLH